MQRFAIKGKAMSPLHRTALVLAVGATALLTGCDQPFSAHNPAPTGTVAASLQPRPDKPLFAAPIVKSHDVLPLAKADTRTPLPPAAPLPQATAVAPSATAGADAQGGAVNPAAGMAAAVTDSKGEPHNATGK